MAAADLIARRSAVEAEIAAISAATAGGLPDGPTGVQHVRYKQSLYEELEQLNKLIAARQGAVEVRSQGVT